MVLSKMTGLFRDNRMKVAQTRSKINKTLVQEVVLSRDGCSEMERDGLNLNMFWQ